MPAQKLIAQFEILDRTNRGARKVKKRFDMLAVAGVKSQGKIDRAMSKVAVTTARANRGLDAQFAKVNRVKASFSSMGTTAVRGMEAANVSTRRTQRTMERLKRTVTGVQARFVSLGRKARGSLGGLGVGIGGGLAAAAVVGGNISFSKRIQELKGLGVATGDSADQFAALRREILNVSKGSIFDSKKVSEAATVLKRSGQDFETVIGSLSATVDFGVANGIDPGQAGDIISKTLSIFGEKKNGKFVDAQGDSRRFADLLTTGAANAATNVPELFEGLKFAGPIAAALGQDIEEVLASQLVLSDFGQGGSIGGAALRGILGKLQTGGGGVKAALNGLGDAGRIELAQDTIMSSIGDLGISDSVNAALRSQKIDLSELKIDENNSLTDVLTKLNNAGFDPASFFKAFEQRGGPAATILAQNLDLVSGKMDILKKATGSTLKIADVQTEGLSGAFERLKSVVDVAIVDFGDGGFSGALTKVFDGISNIIASPIGGFLIGVAAVATSAAVALGGIGLASFGVTSGLAAIGAASTAMSGFMLAALAPVRALTLGLWALNATAGVTATIMAVLTSPITFTIAGIAALGVVVFKFRKTIAAFTSGFLKGVFGEKGLTAIGNFFGGLSKWIGAVLSPIGKFFGWIFKTEDALDGASAAGEWLGGIFRKMFGFIGSLLNPFKLLKSAIDLVFGNTDGPGKWGKAVMDGILGTINFVKNRVFGFINGIIDALNHLPGLGNISRIGETSSGSGSSAVSGGVSPTAPLGFGVSLRGSPAALASRAVEARFTEGDIDRIAAAVRDGTERGMSGSAQASASAPRLDTGLLSGAIR